LVLLGAAPFVAALFRPLPAVLAGSGAAGGSVVLEDRGGHVLGELRATDGTLSLPVRAEDVPRELTEALIVAEDARFRWHPGFDPLAIARALGQLVRHRRIVSGASTLTQQLARAVVPRPAGWLGKWSELTLAVRIEYSLGKSQILLSYLNQVEFGPNLRGALAASRAYFDRDLRSLSLAELAALAAMPRGPSWYDPRRHPERLRARRDWILTRLESAGLVARDRAERARREPLTIAARTRLAQPRHLVRALSLGRLEPWLEAGKNVRHITTTLDVGLQREVEQLVAEAGQELLSHGGSAASAVVIDNPSGEVLAYVGSPDFFDREHLGQNDGCLALRQPGSALKPFVYALAMERLGLGPASLLFDVSMRFDTPTGPFVPQNYDGRFRGPVRMREALGMSLNVPAVDLAARVGVEPLLSFLRSLGLSSLERDASYYGVAVALGDGEISPLALAGAYAVLGRGGTYLPLRFVRGAVRHDGTPITAPLTPARRLLTEETAAEISDILSDDAARAGTFGRHGVLEFEFPVAAKTGTSTNHRDNWAVGYTREVTVVAWAGNFDGAPMQVGTSGVVGAAPLMRRILLAALPTGPKAALVEPGILRTVRVCAGSGALPQPFCPDVVEERVSLAHLPKERCELHHQVMVDPENGLLAGPGCPDATALLVERSPSRLLDWAMAAGRPLGPTESSARCPLAALSSQRADAMTLVIPAEGGSYAIDPHTSRAGQRLVLRVAAGPRTKWVRYRVGEQDSGPVGPPFRWALPLVPGHQTVVVTSDDGSRLERAFVVE
jgi:penicillin-binding protein 1C